MRHCGTGHEDGPDVARQVPDGAGDGLHRSEENGADDGRIVAHTPVYTGPPSYPLEPTPDRRMLALPSTMGGLQTGCATDGRTIFTNGIDALRLASQPTLDVGTLLNIINIMQHGPVSGGRVVALSLDTKAERWRHDRPKVASLGGPPPKRVITDAGDPVGSGIAVANGVVYFTTTVSNKLVALDAAYATWSAGVAGLGDEGWEKPVGPAEGPWAASPYLSLVLHINREAEVHKAIERITPKADTLREAIGKVFAGKPALRWSGVLHAIADETKVDSVADAGGAS